MLPKQFVRFRGLPDGPGIPGIGDFGAIVAGLDDPGILLIEQLLHLAFRAILRHRAHIAAIHANDLGIVPELRARLIVFCPAPTSGPPSPGESNGSTRIIFTSPMRLQYNGRVELIEARSEEDRKVREFPSTHGMPYGLAELGRSGISAIGETPPRSAKPATVVGNLLIAIQASDLLPATFREGFGERALGRLVTVSGAEKDRNRRNPVR